MVHDNFNAMVSSLERASGGADVKEQYKQFLQVVDGHDLWSDNDERSELEIGHAGGMVFIQRATLSIVLLPQSQPLLMLGSLLQTGTITLYPLLTTE